MEKQLLLVLNPCAGQRKANRFLPEIIRMGWDRGYHCVTYVTAQSGDCTRFVAAHAAEYEQVVCIGGDGTLNETIAGVLQSGAQIPIGYIPAGTTNDYASSLGLSSDILQAAQDAMDGNAHSLDVGAFNGRYFTYTASCGAFAKASYSTPQSLKNTLGHLAYILEGIKDLPSIRPYHMRVETESSVIEDDFLFCSISNSTSIGGILKLDSEMVALNDGRFEVMLVRNPVQPMQLSSILHGITTMDLPNDMVHFFAAQKIRVSASQEIEWTLDGERADGVSEVEMRNLHSAIRIRIPKNRPSEAQGEAE